MPTVPRIDKSLGGLSPEEMEKWVETVLERFGKQYGKRMLALKNKRADAGIGAAQKIKTAVVDVFRNAFGAKITEDRTALAEICINYKSLMGDVCSMDSTVSTVISEVLTPFRSTDNGTGFLLIPIQVRLALEEHLWSDPELIPTRQLIRLVDVLYEGSLWFVEICDDAVASLLALKTFLQGRPELWRVDEDGDEDKDEDDSSDDSSDSSGNGGSNAVRINPGACNPS